MQVQLMSFSYMQADRRTTGSPDIHLNPQINVIVPSYPQYVGLKNDVKLGLTVLILRNEVRF